VAVKGNKSGSRLLAVLERIARQQPTGVSELARVLKADKSTVQRALVTLADGGWIYSAPGTPTRWQLTGHIHLVAHLAHRSNGLSQRARAAMESLRDVSGETVGLAVPDIEGFVLIDVVESRQSLRMVPPVGAIVSPEDSATSQAVLPYLPREQQISLLGRPVDATLDAALKVSRRQGYSVVEDERGGGSVNIASPIFEVDGRPIGAVVLCAPRERLSPKLRAGMGKLVLKTACELSLADPKSLPQDSVFRAIGERKSKGL